MDQCVEGFKTSVELLQEATNELKRKFDEALNLKMDDNLDKISSEFKFCYTCPITGEIMVYPKTLPCGHTFESHALHKAIKDNGKCPNCRAVVSEHQFNMIKVNVNLEQLIDGLFKGYRAAKRKTSDVYESQKVLDAADELYQKGLAANKEVIDKAVADVKQIVTRLTHNGWTNAVPSTKRDWDKWLRPPR
jgi:hypothetical protein